MSDDVREIARRFFQEVWNDGDEAAIDRYIVENAQGNNDTFGSGREGFRTQWRKWRAAFPDLHFAVEEVVAEGNTVVARWTLTGTHRGEFMGAAPTGKRISVGGMSLDHIENGMLVSGFDGWDELGMWRQLGVDPPR